MKNGQNKRMRGRNRNKSHHSGGHHHQNPLTRVYESNGPEVKIRGTAHHVAEKYLQLARDANSSGDYVTAENHHQHAEHYFRLIAAAQEQLRQQNPYYQPQQATPGAETNDGSFDGGDDDGDGDGQPMQGQPMQGQQRFGQQPNYNNNQQPNYQPQQNHQPQQNYQPQQHHHQPQHQGRPQHHQQPQQHQQPQPVQQPSYQQPSYQPAPQPPANFDSIDGLPSFITGGQPPQAPAQPVQQGNQNGYDSNNPGGDRFPRHRRRRHRGPRPDLQSPQQDVRGEDGPEPGNI